MLAKMVKKTKQDSRNDRRDCCQPSDLSQAYTMPQSYIFLKARGAVCEVRKRKTFSGKADIAKRQSAQEFLVRTAHATWIRIAAFGSLSGSENRRL